MAQEARLAPGIDMSTLRLQLLLVLSLLIPCHTLANEDSPRIVVISDINGRYASTDYHPRVAAAIQRIVALEPDIVISTGDMIAGQRPSPKLQRAELSAMWESFHKHIRIPLEQSGIPLVMTPGNHDASAYPGFELEREAYTHYHAAHPPSFTPIEGSHFPYNFATAINGILLLSLDATTAGPLDNKQIEWLTQRLCDPQPYRAKIAFGHLPLQPIAYGRQSDVIKDPALESLLVAGGVSAYLSGHHHAYYPGKRIGINMLSMGNLGGNQRRLLGTTMTTGFTFALVQIDSAGALQVSAFKGPDFVEPVNIDALPRHLGEGNERLTRKDIAAPGTDTLPSPICQPADNDNHSVAPATRIR